MKYLISTKCWKNRGLKGLTDFVIEHSRPAIQAAIANGGIGEFELTFKKTGELSEDKEKGEN